jgi:hypothetical protein
VIRLGGVPSGEYLTWYSIEGPQYMEVAVNAIIFAGSVITFWLYPLIADKSMLMLQTAGLEMALNQVS